MPKMVLFDLGKQLVLDEFFRLVTTRESFVLDLYTAPIGTLTESQVTADFTMATFAGYAQIAVARADWTVAAILGDSGFTTRLPAPTFTCTAGTQTVYGWVLRGATSNIAIFGQEFAVPRVLTAGATENLGPFSIQDETLDV